MNFIKFGVLNSSLGTPCGDLANFECSQTPSLVSHSKFAKNSTTSTANTRICDSKNIDSTNQAQIIESNKSSSSLAEGARGWVNFTQGAESSVDSATRTPLISFDSFAKRAAPPTPLPLRAKKLRFFAFRGRASLFPLLTKNQRSHYCSLESDFLHHEAGEFSGASHGFDLDSANLQNSQNLIKKINKKLLQKFLLLFAFAKSRIPLNPTNSNPPNKANSQNLVKNNRARSAHLLKASSGQVLNCGKGVVAEGEGSDFAIRKNPCIQAPAPSLKENARGEKRESNADLSAKGRKTIDSAESQNLQDRLPRRFCESARNDDSFFRFCASPKLPAFNKDDFYFLLVALASLLSLIYLISGASVSYKEAVLLRENSTAIAKIANFSLAHFSHNLGLDFSAKLPNLIFHTLNLLLIYLISNKILKYKRDSVLCVGIYALIPGVIMQASIVNDTILILSIVLFVCYIELRKRSTFLIYPLLLSAVLISKSAFMLCLALFFYTLFKNTNAIPSKDTNQKAHFWIRFWENRIANLKSNATILIFAMFCFGLNLYLFGGDISGLPRGQSLDTIAELALLYSPPLFVYFIYAIYRNFAKYKANLLLYVSGISLIVSIVLSVRQDVNKEIYMFMSLCGIPLMVCQMLSDIRLRLPAFQESYKRRFFIVIAVLVVESSALIFSKQIYRFTNDSEIFLNQFYIAKEVANELKARGISRVSVEGRMQERLAFYGIKDGGQKLRKVKRGGNVVVEYNGKIVAQYAI